MMFALAVEDLLQLSVLFEEDSKALMFHTDC